MERVLAGEYLMATRAGKLVAELRPVAKPGLEAAALLQRWKNLPQVDADAFRRDVDEVIDASL